MTQVESNEFDGYFRDLVQEATCKTCVRQGDTDGVIKLMNPFKFLGVCNDVLHSVHAVDCETGILLSKSKYIRYTELSLYDLKRLHEYVVLLKRYTFVSNTINNKQYGIKE
jgi:hypothetical protein